PGEARPPGGAPERLLQHRLDAVAGRPRADGGDPAPARGGGARGEHPAGGGERAEAARRPPPPPHRPDRRGEAPRVPPCLRAARGRTGRERRRPAPSLNEEAGAPIFPALIPKDVAGARPSRLSRHHLDLRPASAERPPMSYPQETDVRDEVEALCREALAASATEPVRARALV